MERRNVFSRNLPLMASIGVALTFILITVPGLAQQPPVIAPGSTAYALASGYEELIPNLKTTFSCQGRIYGYYADVDNDCQVFHVCFPVTDDNGNVLSTAQFSFFCGNQTVFNQESLTCTDPIDALPCNESPNLYDIKNLEFGIIPEAKKAN
ncbi:hypothetical protein J437_LFUL000209 [Ladona fulva]|uniref:Chitin-binding type-2 domain-containing protein n=1 Tax=Ladona fulva TaxID=123851 RepID=A0A8K0JW13_LADFU|nr:hypothetical protein J437_LFUL000209 [Ladona fulva]